MKKIMFYCPGCGKLTDKMVEIRVETNVYDIVVQSNGDVEYFLEDTLESDHQITKHYCEGKSWKEWFESEIYTAEDFAVDISDPENPELIGGYFDFMNKEEKEKIIENIKKTIKKS